MQIGGQMQRGEEGKAKDAGSAGFGSGQDAMCGMGTNARRSSSDAFPWARSMAI